MLYLLITVLGLVFGSFLNVCIFRLPRKQSIMMPRSHCPACKHLIRWYDNIPVLSYLLLRGRCRDCHARISPQYALVEALTALLLVATFYRYGVSPEFAKYSALVMLLVILIFTDLGLRRIPHSVTVFGIGLGFVLSFFIPVDDRPLGWLLARLGLFPLKWLCPLWEQFWARLWAVGCSMQWERPSTFWAGGRKSTWDSVT